MTVTISRSKLHPTPGTNYRFAWRWIYSVSVPERQQEMHGDSLAWARRIARKYANGGAVVESWSTK